MNEIRKAYLLIVFFVIIFILTTVFVYFKISNFDSKTLAKDVYVYDKNNNLRFFFNYDDSGILIEHATYYKNKVKNRSITFDSGAVKEIFYDTSEKVLYYTVTTNFNNGKKIKKEKFNGDDVVISYSLTTYADDGSRVSFELYDEKNKIVEKHFFYDNMSDKLKISDNSGDEVVFEKFDNDDMYSFNFKKGGVNYTYSYDKKLQVYNEKVFNKDGLVEKEVVYDEDAKVSVEKIYDSNGEFFYYRHYYDKNGNKVKISLFDRYNKLVEYYVYIYNTYGERVKIILYDEKGLVVE